MARAPNGSNSGKHISSIANIQRKAQQVKNEGGNLEETEEGEEGDEINKFGYLIIE